MSIDTRTLYEQFKENWDVQAKMGKTNVCEAAKHFHTPSEMERAIGYSKSNVLKWAKLKANVSTKSEQMAEDWLKRREINEGAYLKVPEIENSINIFLVITPVSSAEKVRRVLAMMGCEFENMR
jgi:hypothetical protein